uniref:Uncharacterized protein n=1 Tax=Lygus hesperus TaxID=30085 RepID=A0A146LV95_LYGHE
MGVGISTDVGTSTQVGDLHNAEQLPTCSMAVVTVQLLHTFVAVASLGETVQTAAAVLLRSPDTFAIVGGVGVLREGVQITERYVLVLAAQRPVHLQFCPSLNHVHVVPVHPGGLLQ